MRVVNDVKEPIKEILELEQVFVETTGIDVLTLKRHLEGQGRLSFELTLHMIQKAIVLFSHEPNLITLSSPVNIVGDIHGQFYDLLTIFTLGGNVHKYTYLFMGDFVDRGLFGFECICYLFALKIKYPKRIFLLRGNHESRNLTKFFTFHQECLLKSNQFIYEKFMQSFDALPVACLLDQKFR